METNKLLEGINAKVKVIMWVMLLTVALSAILGVASVAMFAHYANVQNSPAASANSNCASQGGFDQNC